MANFFKATAKNKGAGKQLTVKIAKLDSNGVGVGKYNNKPVFVAGALPGEVVEVKIYQQKSKYALAKLLQLKSASTHREEVRCAHFSACGGCDIQHLQHDQQLIFKQGKVSELFSRQGVEGELPWQAPVVSSPWGYRRKARIGVQFDKAHNATIGFRQKATNQLVAINSCPVLVEALTDIFQPLKALISNLSVRSAIGHIEAIYAETLHQENPRQVTLVIRQLKPLNKADILLWQSFSTKHHCVIVIDDGNCKRNIFAINDKHGPSDTSTKLRYSLALPADTDIDIHFDNDDFIQINADVNEKMVLQALAWLAPQATDNILDLFCGLGNFSLALAQRCQQVIGVEGVQTMVDKASQNAQLNGVSNCHFFQADLNSNWQEQAWFSDNHLSEDVKPNKVLLDPARAGAEQAVAQIVKLAVEKILYVSCEPSTLARDSQHLLSHGYKISKISLIDMFSHTKHVETMVLFERK